MSEYICRTCLRVVDPATEPSPDEPRRCPDCMADAEREFAGWVGRGWEG